MDVAEQIGADLGLSPAPASPSRPQPLPGAGVRVDNPDGSISTERTIGVNIDGREYVIPTLVGGKQLTPDQAVNEARRRGLQNFPSFATVEEAENYARNRSQSLGTAAPAAAPQADAAAPMQVQIAEQTLRQLQTMAKQNGGVLPASERAAFEDAKAVYLQWRNKKQ